MQWRVLEVVVLGVRDAINGSSQNGGTAKTLLAGASTAA
jgi:hypothetical protein